jgi:hypothetical protein
MASLTFLILNRYGSYFVLPAGVVQTSAMAKITAISSSDYYRPFSRLCKRSITGGIH